MNPKLLEALCTDFTAIYQCDLIQDTIDIIRFDKGTHTDMAIQTMDSYTLHSFSKMIQYFRIFIFKILLKNAYGKNLNHRH